MSLRTNLTAALACLLAGAAIANAGPETRAKPASPAVPLTQVVYPVADLIVPLQNWDDTKDNKAEATLEYRLMELLKTTVAPSSWSEKGGAGSLQYYPLGMTLVVRQTKEVQGDIVDLLAALRRVQDVEVGVELRIVATSAEMGAKFRAKAEFTPARGAKAVPTAFFTAKELYPWFEVLQSERSTNIMQAPKMTIGNGQRVEMRVTTQKSYVADYKVVPDGDQVRVVPQNKTVDVGVRCYLQPVVSADRRFVRLKFDFRDTELVSKTTLPVQIKVGDKTKTYPIEQPVLRVLALKDTGTIADGQTMVVSLGTQMVETQHESAPAGVKGIPYLNRLLTNVSYSQEEREEFLFFTPRIIVNEEEELRATSVVPRQ